MIREITSAGGGRFGPKHGDEAGSHGGIQRGGLPGGSHSQCKGPGVGPSCHLLRWGRPGARGGQELSQGPAEFEMPVRAEANAAFKGLGAGSSGESAGPQTKVGISDRDVMNEAGTPAKGERVARGLEERIKDSPGQRLHSSTARGVAWLMGASFS